MKIAVMAMALLVGGIAFGQDKSASERATRLTTRLTKDLSLNADQAQKINDINLGIAGKNQGIRDNTTFTAEQKKEIYSSNYEAAKSMYKGVLTDAQYTKFMALEKERMDKKAAKKDAKTTGEELDEL